MNDKTPLKQVLILREDLGLSPGKAAAQASHVSLFAAKRASDDVRREWEEEMATKVVLGVADEAELREVASDAREAGLPVSIVNDAGRTEIKEGTTTALGIGPAPVPDVDAITGQLALYSGTS